MYGGSKVVDLFKQKVVSQNKKLHCAINALYFIIWDFVVIL